MSVRIKTLIVLCLTFVTLLGILFFTAQWFFLRDATVAEGNSTIKDITRLLVALDGQITTIDATVGDWAPWDDTYEFIVSGNTDYIDSNLPNEVFTNLGVELMLFINNSGQIVFSRMVDLGSGAEIPIPESLYNHIQVGSRLLSHKDPSDKMAGILSLPEGAMIIASQPIVTSQREGPIRGTLIMGRRLDEADIAKLSQMTQLSINDFPYNDHVFPDDVALALKSLNGVKPIFVSPQNETIISGYALVNDVYGNPALIFRVDTPREAYAQAKMSVRYMGLALLAIGIILCLVTMLLLERVVITRLTCLNSSVMKIGSQGTASSRVEASGNDEIFALATSVNSMLDSLENAWAKERENEEKYRSLFNNAEVGMFRTRIDGSEVLDMNERFLSIFGCTRAEMLGSSSMLQWADPLEREEMVRRLEAEDRIIDFECRMLNKQGEVRICITSLRLYREQGILEGSIVDITARKRSELIQNAIYRITQTAITSDGIESLYHSIHSILGVLIPAENFFIALYDSANELISFPYYIDQFDQPPLAPTPIQGLTGYVIRTGCPLLATREIFDRLVQQGEVEAVGTTSEDWMGVPLKVEGHMIGVIAVQSYIQGIHFDQEDLNLLEFVSTQVAQAIERKRMEQEINSLSMTDELTGLNNRRGFTLLAEQEVKLAQRFKRSALLLFCDVDNLKMINDTWGHAQGDQALIDVGAILKETLREADIAARFGGDEFVVLAVGASMESADILTNHIQAALEMRKQKGGRLYQLSLSFGIDHYDPEAPSTLSELIAKADDLMYRQKQAKKGKK